MGTVNVVCLVVERAHLKCCGLLVTVWATAPALLGEGSAEVPGRGVEKQGGQQGQLELGGGAAWDGI